MTTISASTAQSSQASLPGGQASPPQSGEASVLTSDFETFLKMLTVQARYQDPLEPLDSSEYAAQLAQFSMVEQQVQTNDTLSALVTRLGSSDMSTLSNWVGMEVQSPAAVQFDGRPLTVIPRLEHDADQAFLVARDPGGAVVDRREIPLKDGPYVWDGKTSNGDSVLVGLYGFSVESYRTGTVISEHPASTYAKVVEAQIDGGDVVLLLDGGSAVSSADVTAVRASS